MREWIEPQGIQIPEKLGTAIGGHPLVAKTLARRGFADLAEARGFLDPDFYAPAPPSDLPDLARAAERLETAIRLGETICVWGDFDVDGQTATTILVSTLRELGAAVTYHIPVRETESHGINLTQLQQLIAEGANVVLTCDTGVTAHDAIAYAQARGVDVIVTDHHDLPSSLPEAYAIVNPKMLAADHPLGELPGVGCAYELADLLYDRAGRGEDASQHLDLVALGIVADVAMQTKDTRYLLQRGLEALRHTERLGLQVMMEVAQLNRDWITEEHIGFVLGPRLNAVGRLADANVAVELLTTDDQLRAHILAHELEGLNARRKLLTDQVLQAAEAQIERDPALLELGALVLSHPTWPAGVIGIVAGRLAERYGRPTIIIANPPGQLARGSARSIQGYDISAAIATHAEMLEGFGGHPMAAGLSVDPDRIPEFRRVLSRTVLETLGEVRDGTALQIAGYLSLADLSLDLVKELERLAPFGPGNPPLILASEGLSLTSHKPVGRNDEHLQLIVEDEDGIARKVIWWQWAGLPLPQGAFDLAYAVRASDYRGQRDVQVEWVDARLTEAPAVALRPELSVAKIVDYRRVPNPRSVLDDLREQKTPQIWSEAGAKAEVEGSDRNDLRPSKDLVIWTTPPGLREFREVLGRVSPETIYLFAIDPHMDNSERFLTRLAGLIRHVLSSSDGRACVSSLAAATAQRQGTVRAGVAWLEARGHIVVLAEDGDELHLAAGGRTASANLPLITAQLDALLEETAARRTHLARVDTDTLTLFGTQ